MSAGGGTYNIRVNLDATQAIASSRQLQQSFEGWNQAAQRTVGSSSALSGAISQINNPMRHRNSNDNNQRTLGCCIKSTLTIAYIIDSDILY
jgi:hypothetical protein